MVTEAYLLDAGDTPSGKKIGGISFGIRHILVCLDRSPLSELCLPYGIHLAKMFGSSVTLLCVLQSPQPNGVMRATDALEWEILRHEASSYLARLQQETSQATKLQVDTRLEQGHPAERIIAVARELGADLTVLGDHGERGMTAWELGSTAQQVLSVARGSVLIGRGIAQAPRVGGPASILVPLDGSARTESVLPTVVRIARARGAEVLLAHAVTEPQRTAVLSSEEDVEMARELAARMTAGASRYLEQIRGRLAREVAVRTVVLRHVDERESLLDLVAREGVELIVMSAHGATCNPARPFGNVTSHLLTHSAVPVLVLQDLASGAADDQRAPQRRSIHPPERS